MNHMTDTGIKGIDLYAWENHWQPVKAGLPTGKTNERVIISNMTAQEREYIMFLPLYDGIISLSIGIDSTAYIKNPALPYPTQLIPFWFTEPASLREDVLQGRECRIPTSLPAN